MATVKEILAEDKRKENEKAKKAKEAAKREREHEANELHKASKVIEEALEGFEYERGGSVFGSHFKVKVGNREVFVVYKFETHDVQYSDDTAPIETRSLSIDIGYLINRPSWTTSVDSFAQDFVYFLKRERLA